MSQADLFESLRLPVVVLPMAIAKASANVGIQRAAERAERTEPGWVDRAAEAVRDYALNSLAGINGEFTIDEARPWIAANTRLADPPDGRAWGAATRRALKLGYIVATDGYAPAASSNGSPKRLYRRGPGA